jgi:hypothetical protein
MHKLKQTITLGAVVLTSAAAATAIGAYRSSAAMMSEAGISSMMRGRTSNDRDMLSSEMRGGMMGRRGGMMGHCSDMMSGDSRGARPNDQWRNGGRSDPDKDK